MAELIDRLRERAEFEDRSVLDEAKALGFVPEVYSGSQTGALLREAAAALEAAREDADRYRWLREYRLPQDGDGQVAAWIEGRGNDHIESEWLTGEQADAAIDQARGNAWQAI